MKLDEETTQIVEQAALEASRDAVRQVRERGLPLTVVADGRVVKTYSDGRTVIKSSVGASKLKLTKGTILVFDTLTLPCRRCAVPPGKGPFTAYPRGNNPPVFHDPLALQTAVTVPKCREAGGDAPGLTSCRTGWLLDQMIRLSRRRVEFPLCQRCPLRGAMSMLSKKLQELESLNAEAISERDRLDKICREMIDAMKAAEAEWADEKQALVDERNHWFTLWKQASNEVLQRTPSTGFKKPGPLPKASAGKGKGPSASELVISDRDVTSESMADYEARRTLTLDELWAKIDGGPHWDEVMTSEEMDEAKATRGLGKETLALLTLLGLSSRDVAAGRVSPLAEALSEIRNVDPIKDGIRKHMRWKLPSPLQAEVERLQARVKQLVDEALEEAPMDTGRDPGLFEKATGPRSQTGRQTSLFHRSGEVQTSPGARR